MPNYDEQYDNPQQPEERFTPLERTLAASAVGGTLGAGFGGQALTKAIWRDDDLAFSRRGNTYRVKKPKAYLQNSRIVRGGIEGTMRRGAIAGGLLGVGVPLGMHARRKYQEWKAQNAPQETVPDYYSAYADAQPYAGAPDEGQYKTAMARLVVLQEQADALDLPGLPLSVKSASTALTRRYRPFVDDSILDITGGLAYGFRNPTTGRELGRLNVVRQHRAAHKGTTAVHLSNIDPEFQGMGLGSKMYGGAIHGERAAGQRILSSDMHGGTSPKATKMWERSLRDRKGYPVRAGDEIQNDRIFKERFQVPLDDVRGAPVSR